MFVAGTAAVGVAHQIIFLSNSPVALFHDRNNRSLVYRIKCQATMRQIREALWHYAKRNEALPERLDDVVNEIPITRETFLCPAEHGSFNEAAAATQPFRTDYIYVGRGLKWPVEPKTVLMYESLGHHDEEGINVLYGDGHVEWVEEKEAKKLIAPTSKPAS
jgi:prepilin-type processing-associated H-X9-DG protein